MATGTVFLATIELSMPEFGVALVRAAKGSTTMKQLLLANLPLNDATSGAVPQANFVDGTSVVCLVNPNAPEKAYIICPANYAIGDLQDYTAGRALYNVTEFTESMSTAFTTALENLLQGRALDFQNFSHGADQDAIPGDNDIIDLNGNAGIHVGRLLSQLRGSPAAFIDVSNIAHAIRMVANKIDQHLPLSVILSGKELIVHNVAINDAESFGLSSGNPLVENDGTLELADEHAIPLYRLQKAEGAVIDGEENIVVSFPDTDVHYCTTEPSILAKKRTSLDGAISDASANCITSIKSPAIHAIHQINYSKNRGQEDQDDILQPYEDAYIPDSTVPQPPEDHKDWAISDAALNKIIDALFTGDYLDKLCEKMAEHGLKVSTDDGLLRNRIKKSGNFKIGAIDEQEYNLPDSIQLIDPVTGKATNYFATTSFISQEPDGSILICDGYGSEIRMSRGNIYISPALDLFLRPGRDLSAMVPRHQSYNAQRTTTINTAGSMYVRAVKDLKMAGATGGSGIVSLECDAIDKTVTEGLILKSMGGATFTGTDLYIGINAGTGTAKNNVEGTSKAGTIVIDANNNGRIDIRSAEHVVDAMSICLVANNSAMGSAIVVNTSSIGIYTRGVSMPAQLSLVGTQAANKVTIVRNGAKQDITLANASIPQFMVEGAAIIGGQFVCNGQGKFCEGVAAKGVISNNQFCGVADYTYQDPFEHYNIEQYKEQPQTDIGNNTAESVVNLATSIYQDFYVTTNGFAFPDTYGISEDIRVPGMLWQVQTNEAGGSVYKWSEPVYKGADGTVTMCYPGKRVWNKATVSDKEYKSSTLNEGYIVNTIPEKTNG